MHFTVEAQARIRAHVQNLQENLLEWQSPLFAVDATAGNGFDTEFLSSLVGESGKVLAIDLQSAAIEATTKRLRQANASNNVAFVQGSHAELLRYIEMFEVRSRFGQLPLAVVMFNLGYLPYGDKTVITKSSSTIPALDQSYELLRIGGMLSILSYPGHEGGNDEHQAVEEWVAAHQAKFHLERFQDRNNPRSPVLWLACKQA